MPKTPTPGAQAPDLAVPLIIGPDWELSRQDPKAFTMVVVYRGLHCPICKEYLGELRSLYDDFLDKGFVVINVSMDGADKARQAHEEWGLDPIPMGHSMSEDQARDWGLYLSSARNDKEPEVFAEPAVFWVKPDGTLFLVNVSNVPFARPPMRQLLDRADFVLENDYPARGTHSG